LSARFQQLDFSQEECHRLAMVTLTALEGAFVLCRTLRSVEPIAVAGHAVQAAVRAAVEQ
jgi:hypothetical protein